jgi:ABC-type microcin C transport system permease subunit YejE
MKKLIYAPIVFAMILSIVFLSEAISSDNPLSVKAQSTQYQAKNYPTKRPYKKKYVRPYRPHHSYGYCYRVVKVKRCRWVRVLRCRWVTKKIRIKCPRPYYRKPSYSPRKPY